jgi:c-di-AMP phosphodiesterase-like protein
MSNKKFDPFRKLEELPYMAYVLLAVLCIVVHVLLCTFIPTVSVAVCGLALTGIYLLASLVIHLAVRRRMSLFRLASNASEEQNNGVIYTFRHMLKTPYAVVTEKGKIVTVNVAMENIAGAKSTVFGADITDICGIPLSDLTDHANESMDEESDEEAESIEILADKKAICHIGDRVYHIDCHSLHSKGKQYYLMMFNDITDLFHLNAKNRAEFTAVAYIVIDNLDEIAQYAKVSYQAEASQVDAILKQWAADMGGILREYDRYKYILLLTRHSMLACAKTKFEILDKIREIRLGDDNIPITVSIGMTTLGNDLAEREHEALICLDMALQRGGDQVVMKNEVNTFFFGGRTKSQQKRSGGQSRVIASKLCAMISASTNVLIMGHSNPDFDSIGACVGIASLCMHLGVNAKIVANVESENFKACTGRLIELADYKNMFVNSVEGLEEMEFGTLLIVVDANNFRILEAPEIANNAFNIAIIDHHIKKEEFEHPPKLTYIDPSASSACELVSEILEFSIPVGTLRKEEANVIMAGIMVDTQNFTRTVGTRTFAAALYLRGAGASPEYARTFFEQGLEDYHSEALFGTNAQIYGEQIAITVSEGTGSPHDRVAAAKAADKLLSVKNVNAAFALVVIGESVHISGRSNGKINVQLILEKIGGGGHFDVAGAAIADSDIDAAKATLIAAIDEYLADTAQNSK